MAWSSTPFQLRQTLKNQFFKVTRQEMERLVDDTSSGETTCALGIQTILFGGYCVRIRSIFLLNVFLFFSYCAAASSFSSLSKQLSIALRAFGVMKISISELLQLISVPGSTPSNDSGSMLCGRSSDEAFHKVLSIATPTFTAQGLKT